MNTRENINKQIAIQDVIEFLSKTTKDEPYMSNALKRLQRVLPKIVEGKYTKGSI